MHFSSKDKVWMLSVCVGLATFEWMNEWMDDWLIFALVTFTFFKSIFFSFPPCNKVSIYLRSKVKLQCPNYNNNQWLWWPQVLSSYTWDYGRRQHQHQTKPNETPAHQNWPFSLIVSEIYSDIFNLSVVFFSCIFLYLFSHDDHHITIIALKTKIRKRLTNKYKQQKKIYENLF